LKRLFLLSFACLISFLPGWTLMAATAPGESQPPQKSPLMGREPIRIDADRLDAYNDQRLVVFSGNAVAVQGDKVLKADKLLLYYKKGENKKEKVASTEVGKSGDLDRIEAKGHVTMTQGERIVTGEEAVYFQGTQQVVVTGNPVMREKKNVVRGDRIIVFLKENRGVVESLQRKRVTATVYPAEKNEEKK